MDLVPVAVTCKARGRRPKGLFGGSQKRAGKELAVASFKGVQGALVALGDFFKRRFPKELGNVPVNTAMSMLCGAQIAASLSRNLLGVYQLRVTIVPHLHTHAFMQQGPQSRYRKPCLPVYRHFLCVSSGTNVASEADPLGFRGEIGRQER